MGGIVFFRTTDLGRVLALYRAYFDVETWLDQDGCPILERGGFRFGFCDVLDDCLRAVFSRRTVAR